jgi:hypothetical protein
MIEEGKRYQKVNGEYIEHPAGQHLGKKGPFGSTGLLDLGGMTQLGFPMDPATGMPYTFVEDYHDPIVVELCLVCNQEPCVCPVCPTCGKR